MPDKSALEQIAKKLVAPRKGILAADESTGTITKRFTSIGLKSTPELNKLYRLMLFTTPDIEKFISGIILFDETIKQSDDKSVAIPKLLEKKGIIPGIKVDKGTKDMANFPGEKITEGLDGLRERLVEYNKLGAKFTKWRAVFTIGEKTPTDTCISSNSEALARFAALSQEVGMVPIVEPEVLMEGNHTLDKSKEVSKKVLKEVFLALEKHGIYIKGMLLKPSWIHPGFDNEVKAGSKTIAQATLEVFKDVLPDDLPGVVFLSGGDNPEDSTRHLDALNEIGALWELGFSFGRALQEPALKLWAGKKENIEAAQRVFYERARLNSLARTGDY